MNTKKVIGAILILITIFSCTHTEQKKNIPLVNKNATEKAQNLYNFIQKISGKYTLSGQHEYCGKGSVYHDQLEQLTGKKAIIWGSDFSWYVLGDSAKNYQHCGPLNLTAPATPFDTLDITMEEARDLLIAEVEARYAEGHIITLMWHGCFPTDGDCCDGASIWAMENRPTPEMWNELVTDGTPLNNAWKTGADKIATYLKQLQDKNIPVLWRPYHEMNGVWFWWCNQKGEQGFKRLWIMMYKYYTEVHQLNNLIWVWNTNAPRDIPNDEAFQYSDFYPGDEYVDILAADVYRNDYKQSHHDDLMALAKGKPIVLGEVAEIPDAKILKSQPNWAWYMPWGWLHFTANNEALIKEMMTSEKVLTTDEITVDATGNYSLK
jgi:mannan endo-1,4-beta-mannosidase